MEQNDISPCAKKRNCWRCRSQPKSRATRPTTRFVPARKWGMPRSL